MKVAHVTCAHPPFDVRIYEKMCRFLVANDIAVTLVAPNEADVTKNGVQIRGIKQYKSRILRALLTGFSAAKRAIEERPDIVHLHDPELLLWVNWLKSRGVVVVFDMHENMGESLKTKKWIPESIKPLILPLWLRIERRSLRRIPVIFAEKSYEELYGYLSDTAVVLNMPLAERLLRIREAKHSRFTVVYVGRIAETRGSLLILRALSVLNARGLDIGLELIGPIDKHHKAQLEREASGLGIEERVTFFGRQEADTAWRMAAKGHVGLAVLQEVGNYVNSYPTKMFEYMGLRLPVIASDFQLYREVVERERCGICVDPQSPDQLAHAIERIYRDPAEAKVMGMNGQLAVKEYYNWATEGAKLVDFYKSIAYG